MSRPSEEGLWMDENSKLSRRGFVALTGAASLSALLAACGGGEAAAEPAGRPSPRRRRRAPRSRPSARRAAAPAVPTFDPATEPDGPVTFFEWAGYDDTAPWMWQTYTDSEYNAGSPLKFEFLENDIQALAKVASGYSPDVIHPCIAYWPDFQAAGLIQPFDTALLPDLRRNPRGHPERRRQEDTGLTYHVPFDIGFSSLVYRADKIPITPEEESWSLLLDPAYEGQLATYSDPVTIIKIGALINAGEPIDPNELTSEQIQAAKETMIKAKPQIRNFWSDNQDNIDDFINGNVWATYMWPDGYLQAIRHEKLEGVDVATCGRRKAASPGSAASCSTRPPSGRAGDACRRRGEHAGGGRLADRRLRVRRGAAGTASRSSSRTRS